MDDFLISKNLSNKFSPTFLRLGKVKQYNRKEYNNLSIWGPMFMLRIYLGINNFH